MNRTTREIGYEGESLAETYLTEQGYSILEKNFAVKGAEIDLIATEGASLVFIEVKHHSREDYGTMLDRVNAVKQKRIIFAARIYLSRRPNLDMNCRFDVLAIRSQPAGEKIFTLIKDAFRWDDRV